MKGEISVKSLPGVGSTFSVRVPLERRSAPVQERRKSSNGFAKKSGGRRRKDNALLVAEDNRVNQEVIADQLKRLGYRAHFVANGHEVLKALESGHYDVVLMDCQMPEMDGYQASQAIRASVNSRHVVIIGVTANALGGDREKCLAAGMDDYLPKPLTLESLDDALKKWAAPSTAAVKTAPVMQLDQFRPLYRLQTIKNLSEIRSAFQTGDATGLERAFHTLKGSSAQLGISGMRFLSEKAEHLAAAGRLEETEELIEKLEKEFQDLCRSWKIKGGSHEHENGSRRR
jgi:CheY-like chemotaxis protein